MHSIIDVKNLKIGYFASRVFKRKTDCKWAVEDISFSIPKGKTLGLVGESGCGKTSTGRALVGLSPVLSGSILFNGTDISKLSKKSLLPYRKKIQMIFQDPFGSLNPKMSVYDILAEPLDIHFSCLSSYKQERIAHLLTQVGLSSNAMYKYPHEFSGGQRQRIGIARALAVEPEVIVCDEPVSALDVCVQAQIINLLQDLQDSLGLSYLFIGHDLAVVKHISHTIMVMKSGKIVEEGPAEEIVKNPKHSYTQMLIEGALP